MLKRILLAIAVIGGISGAALVGAGLAAGPAAACSGDNTT